MVAIFKSWRSWYLKIYTLIHFSRHRVPETTMEAIVPVISRLIRNVPVPELRDYFTGFGMTFPDPVNWDGGSGEIIEPILKAVETLTEIERERIRQDCDRIDRMTTAPAARWRCCRLTAFPPARWSSSSPSSRPPRISRFCMLPCTTIGRWAF